MSTKTIKIIGYIATISGIGISLLSDWVGKQQMSQEISDEVTRQLSEVIATMSTEGES